MDSKFNTTNETKKTEYYQTKQFRKNRDMVENIMNVAAYIHIHYIGLEEQKEWSIRLNQGSITFQKDNNPHKVVTIFYDFENQLAYKEGFNINQKDSIVIGIELTKEEPFIREAIRGKLDDMFNNHKYDPRNYYRDPRKGSPKYYLTPNEDHLYDIIFLPQGKTCQVPENVLEQYLYMSDVIESDKKKDLPNLERY